VMLLTISIVLAVILLESSSSLSSSSAAPPACLDGFIVETNGGTGVANTCTLLVLYRLVGGG